MHDTLQHYLSQFLALIITLPEQKSALINPDLITLIKAKITAYPELFSTLPTTDKLAQFIDPSHQLITLMAAESNITSKENQHFFSAVFFDLANLCIQLYETMQTDKLDIPEVAKHALMNKLVIANTSLQVSDLSKKLFLLFYHSYTPHENTFDHLIDLKLLAHRLGLKGISLLHSAKQPDEPIEVNFESFEPQYTMPEALYSFWNFSQKTPIDNLKYCVNQTLFSLQAIVDSQHHFADIAHCSQLVEQYQAGQVIVISSGLYNHSANFILADTLIVILNRGAYAKHAGADFYTIGNQAAITPQLVQSLFSATVSTAKQAAYYEALFRYGIYEKLQLSPAEAYDLPAKNQSVGNCTWANIKMTIQALLLIHLLKQYADFPLTELKKIAHYYYKTWTDFDRTRALKLYLYRYFYHATPCKADKDLLKNQLLMQYDLKKPGEVQRGILAVKALGAEIVHNLLLSLQHHVKEVPQVQQAIQFILHCQAQAMQERVADDPENADLLEEKPSYLTSFSIHLTIKEMLSSLMTESKARIHEHSDFFLATRGYPW